MHALERLESSRSQPVREDRGLAGKLQGQRYPPDCLTEAGSSLLLGLADFQPFKPFETSHCHEPSKE